MTDYLIYIQVASLIAITLLFHKKLGVYPEKLPVIREKKKELIEIFIIWAIMFCIITYIMLKGIYLPFLFYPTIVIVPPIQIDLYLILSFIFPFLIARFWKEKSEISNLALQSPKNWKTSFVSLLIMALFSIITFVLVGGPTLPFVNFLWGIITPAMSEEFISRGIFTSKLERVYGVNKGWFYSGILFGLLHIPNDFFGYFWYSFGQNLIVSMGLWLNQIVTGWILGIVFIKSRSILIPIIIHYSLDFLPAILQTLLF